MGVDQGKPVPDERKLRLSVMGFASSTWSASGVADPKKLNLFLAEGRRIAVIRELMKHLKDVDGLNDLLIIENNPKKLDFRTEADVKEHEVKPAFHFRTYDEMREALSKWAIEPDGAPADQPSKREVFVRSVVIGIENNALAMCGKRRR